jgi:hypothetical protein
MATADEPRRAWVRLLLLVLVLAVLPAGTEAEAPPAPGIGLPPLIGTAGRDLGHSFALPRLRNEPLGGPARQLADLQVGRRAAQLGIDAASAHAAWLQADGTLNAARARLAFSSPLAPHLFGGQRVSQLNALLRDKRIDAIRVTSERLEVDEPLLIRRPKVWLDLGRAELRAARSMAPERFLARIENATGATLEGGAFLSGAWGLLVNDSRDVTVKGTRFDGLQRGGVVATDAAGLVLSRLVLQRLGAAPVLLHGATVDSAVLDNQIVQNHGVSNWNAGIVLSDREAAVTQDPDSLLRDDRFGIKEQRIDKRLRTPRRNLIAFNRVTHNLSSGIYSDGGLQNVFFDNLLEGNAKEGLCLDNGSAANVVAMNVIRLNGKRWGMSDAALKLDFVHRSGRLADGSSAAKTPALSIDNAVHNIVYANQIDRNYGGGVKMVRTAFFNLIGLNVITDNNLGASDKFHFFGIELGSAVADTHTLDLDYTPSRGNMVFGNVIRGSHYAGIFLGAGSTDNDVFDNTIFGATRWALEQARPQPNASLNNLSNLPSRNVHAGIDPRLMELTKGRYDNSP